MSIARGLAERVAAMNYRALPPAAIHWAKVCIADTVGVMLAGNRENAPRLAAMALTPCGGSSLIFGSTRRVSALDAALVNGTAAHALDFDDSNHTMGGHPSAPVVSSLFALADEIGVSGSEFINAYVTGYEVDTRLGLGVNFHHYIKGWHPTATLGVFGTAAACALLLNLSEGQIATAIAVAVSFSSGVKANFGTMMKPLHAGRCAKDGLFAALLAKQGFTANDASAFEHEHGFFNVFNGEGTYDISKILKGWADPLNIVDPGITIKRHPCCGSTHASVDTMLMLARQNEIKIDDVERIDVAINSRRLAHTDRPDPQSALGAKFSIQYCLVRALRDRKILLEHFEGDDYRDPTIRELMQRVHATAYPDAATNPHGADIEITMRDGSKITGQVLERDSLSPEVLKEKFINCVTRVGSLQSGQKLHAAIDKLESIKDVRELTRLIEAHPQDRAVSASALHA